MTVYVNRNMLDQLL